MRMKRDEEKIVIELESGESVADLYEQDDVDVFTSRQDGWSYLIDETSDRVAYIDDHMYDRTKELMYNGYANFYYCTNEEHVADILSEMVADEV